MSIHETETVGSMIITWPKPGKGHLFGGRIALADADSGEVITTALDLDLTVHTDTQSLITAEITMFADADGKPLGPGEPVTYAEDGENLATGRFRWLVSEMRIAE